MQKGKTKARVGIVTFVAGNRDRQDICIDVVYTLYMYSNRQKVVTVICNNSVTIL